MRSHLDRAYRLLDEKEIDALLVTQPFNVSYYTGIRMIADSIMVLVVDKGGASLYVPLLEYYRVRDAAEGIDVYAVSKKIKPGDVRVAARGVGDIIDDAAGKYRRIGVDLDESPLLPLILKKLGDRLVDVSMSIWRQRMIKDDWEIDVIKRAVEATYKGIMATAYSLSPDVSETMVAGFFEMRARMEGAEEMAFPPLTLFKPGNSYPHNLPSPRNRLGDKNLVLIDVGVYIDGYCSDITRMVTWGGVGEDEKKALETLVEAIDNVIDNAEPGMSAEEIDGLARSVVEKHGYGDRFIHGLGHGIGLYVHEKPRLGPGSTETIEPGMVFTVEPGIYLPGRFGVRIEEDVVMTKKGLRVLSSMIPRIIEL